MKKWLCLFLLAVPTLFAQSIEGTVVDTATGLPLSGAKVTLRAGGSPAYQVTTNTYGAFRILPVKAGTYNAGFEKAEYLAAPGTSITIPPGSDVVRLDGKLTPFSKVSGRVYDQDGQPVTGAELLLDGSRSGRSIRSDAQGNFEFRASPGNYLLSARAPSSGLKAPAGMTWAHTYYPGVVERAAATRISVQAGVDAWGQDIQLRTTPVHRVRGMVQDANGNPAPKISVEAARVDEILPQEVEIEAQADGSFEFPALAEGSWRIFAEANAGAVRLRGFALVELTRDQDRVEVRLAPPFTLSGSVVFSGADTTQSSPQRASLILKPVVPGEEGMPQGNVNPDGTFRIDKVYADAYKIVAVAPGTPYFLSSIRMGDREILGQYVDLSSGTFPLKITFDSQGGGVHGTVDRCGGATVVLAPQDKNLQEPQFVYTARCANADQFDFVSVRPGDYYAFAFEQWDSPADLLSNLNQTLVNQAVRVKLERGRTENVDLRLTAHP